MSQPSLLQSIEKEGQLLLAISAIKQGQIQAPFRAAKTYDVPRTTLERRRAGIPSRRDCTANSKKLSNLEESVVIQHTLNLVSKGFAPRLDGVRDMANSILAARGNQKVGINWPANLIKRSPELKMRFDRKIDYQRAVNEDPEIIGGWFRLVRNTINKYGITDDDIFNFDETGFMMGIAATAKVVTASERRHRPKSIQPGNREWVTVIQAVNAQGWIIPPFVIFGGQYHLEAWYSTEIPRDWRLSVSDNGWTTNELGFEWLQHFESHTKDRTKGSHRLLILDGHESHNSLQFQDFCKDHNIITLCMPPHSSHILQPLDVGCFAPLKKAYSKQIEDLIRNGINHITKLEFLPAFKTASDAAFTSSNIKASFRGAGLHPYDPDAVISKLDIKLKTPTPPPIDDLLWESQTPANVLELASQKDLIKASIIRHQSSSLSPILQAVEHLSKGAQLMAHQMAILQSECAGLRKANEIATKRRERKKRRIQHRGSLTIGEGLDSIDQTAVDAQISQETRAGGPSGDSISKGQRRCGNCGVRGHYISTCPIREADEIEVIS
jgi:hypothetical protein